ncbi:MAG: hypothetical protein CMJ93_08055 [Planctomycetes bacterium]|nr:hypothetical protein [Planctomycetota bacterium]
MPSSMPPFSLIAARFNRSACEASSMMCIKPSLSIRAELRAFSILRMPTYSMRDKVLTMRECNNGSATICGRISRKVFVQSCEAALSI